VRRVALTAIAGATAAVGLGGCDPRDPESGAPAIVTTSVADAQLGLGYSQPLAARGGSAPLRWAIASAAPELGWLSIHPDTGMLSGVPNTVTAGSTFRVQIADTRAVADARDFTLLVRACQDGEVVACAESTNGTCSTGLSQCSGGAVGACSGATPSSDPGRCGAACTACGPTADRCASGECRCGIANPCPGGSELCCGTAQSAACVDTLSSLDHCGACGVACDRTRAQVNEACLGGVCNYSLCEPGWARCPEGSTSSGCDTNVLADPSNCGGCGNACRTSVINGSPAQPACNDGRCAYACTALWLNCNDSWADGCEKNGGIDEANCGTCGRQCAAPIGGWVECVNGQCVESCGPDQNICTEGGTRICRSRFDMNNCGTCGNVCPTSAQFASSVTCDGTGCVLSCLDGFANCDGNVANGCEADLDYDRNNCGGCNRRCLTACEFGHCCTPTTCF
jgi:hypothetical protein